MKKISKFLFIFLVLFQAAALYAEDLKVIVDLFVDKASDRALAERVAIASSEAVIQSKGFRYISPTEAIRIMTGDEKVVPDKVPDPRKEYSEKNIEHLDKVMAAYGDKSGDSLFNLLGSIDIMINYSVKRDGPLVKVELMMVNSKNQRQFDVTIMCEESALEEKVRKKAAHFLKRLTGPLKVYADKLVSEKDSIVTYQVKATDDSDITIEGNYTGDRPDPQAQAINILPPENIKKEGMTRYQVKTEEGKLIDMDFTFKDGKLYSVKVDTPIPDPKNTGKQAETLTMKSSAGYALKFEFAWDNGDMEYAKLDPELNPFGDYDEE